MIAEIAQDIKDKIRGKVRYNEPMNRHTSFCIGGPADIWVEPESPSDLRNCIQLSKGRNIPLFVIGSGTNLLVKDEGIRGMVISTLSPGLKNIYRSENSVWATSSITLKELLDFCFKEGLGGLEFLSGVPGTVGGAVATNAGARHYKIKEKQYSISDFTEEVKAANSVIFSAGFRLTAATRDFILAERGEFLKRKKATQELSAPSAGCIFKNPPGYEKPAGELIDKCGLKGLNIGGAIISRKHANFIINTGGATAADVIALIDIIKNRVKDSFGIELITEITIV